jgi:transglutaminase-like putative cysteine protease
MVFSFLTTYSYSQQQYNGLPVLRANKYTADYRINDQWTRGNWRISPELSPDVLQVPTFSKKQAFAFYTDVDSIAFVVDGKTVQQFYVLTADGKYALTEIKGFDFEPVSYNKASKASSYKFWYENGAPNEYLQQLKTAYRLDEVIAGARSDSAKALRILNWVHHQWRHNGSNQPQKNDALSILAEAKEGKNFRCVEYGIVATAALNAIGLPARVLALKTKDVETTESGAGHVLLEVYLKDLKKWVLMDGQFNITPLLNGIPLNAVELQHAIAKQYDQLEIRSMTGASKAGYLQWVYPYLYYLDVPFDNREGPGKVKEKQLNSSHLMLVPEGAKQPTVFQKKWPISNMLYTHHVADFYAPPANSQ